MCFWSLIFIPLVVKTSPRSIYGIRVNDLFVNHQITQSSFSSDSTEDISPKTRTRPNTVLFDSMNGIIGDDEYVPPIPHHNSNGHIWRLFNAAAKFSKRVQRKINTKLSEVQPTLSNALKSDLNCCANRTHFGPFNPFDVQRLTNSLDESQIQSHQLVSAAVLKAYRQQTRSEERYQYNLFEIVKKRIY